MYAPRARIWCRGPVGPCAHRPVGPWAGSAPRARIWCRGPNPKKFSAPAASCFVSRIWCGVPVALVVEQTQKKDRRLRRASLYQGSCIDCFPIHSFKLFRAFMQISLCPPPPFPIHGDRLLVSGVPFLRPYPNFFGACGGLCVLVAMARIIMMKIIIMMMVLIMSFIA